MNSITDILGLRVPALLDTENGTKEVGGKPALYQSRVFQPAVVAESAPAPAVALSENSLPNLDNMPFYG